MKQVANFLIFAVTAVIQFVVGYLLAFITFVGLAEVFGLGASATVPDPVWVSIVVYGLTAVALGLGMWGVGVGIAKLRKQPAPGVSHFFGAVIGGGIGWAWLQSTPMGQMRSPLILIILVFVGYYLPDLIGMVSGKNEG